MLLIIFINFLLYNQYYICVTEYVLDLNSEEIDNAQEREIS